MILESLKYIPLLNPFFLIKENKLIFIFFFSTNMANYACNKKNSEKNIRMTFKIKLKKREIFFNYI